MNKRRSTSQLTPPNSKIIRSSISNNQMNNNDQSSDQLSKLLATVPAIMDDENVPPYAKTLIGLLMANLKLNNINTDLAAAAESGAEEKERKRSLVFVNVNESIDSKPSNRAQADTNSAVAILDALGVQATPTAVYRLGGSHRASTGRPRLLKVILPAHNFQEQTLRTWERNRRTLRTGNWSQLFIRPSLTRAQLQEEYEERQRKRQNGNGTRNGIGTGILQSVDDLAAKQAEKNNPGN